MSYKANIVQRSATRNQSTADFSRENLFLYGNRYSESIFKNNTGANLTAMAGILVVRDVTAPTKVIPADYDTVQNPNVNTLGDVVGILTIEGEKVLANNGEMNCNVCISGDIDAGLLVLPDGVTLNTVVGTKVLKDILTGLGFVLHNVTENAKFDN
jgi:hypothetical protein